VARHQADADVSDLGGYLATKRTEVERHLDAALRPRPGLPEGLRGAMRYSALAPGKRLRPLLVVLAAEACAGGREVVPWPAACAVEIIHAYSLIHDDLPAMDDDDLRRGQPTCHKKFGEATAILAGDALQALAFELLASGYPPQTGAACCLDLARAAGAAGMVGGQADDLAWERTPDDGTRTVEGLEHLHERKTGALIRAALRLGGHVAFPAAAAPAGLLGRLDRYGRCIGLAFQITDDLLDVEGDIGQTGKAVRKDAARGKLTYPGLLGAAESRRRAERLVRDALGHLEALGPAADRLAGLADLILQRDR
jgi:geranylgeranyl diphosphate synthase type II